MKWCMVITLTISCCTGGIAQEFVLTTVPLPEPEPSTSINSTRIIGGTATTIQNFPYTVQVLYNRRLACGGSLITRRHVLSAAHCFFDANNIVVPPSRYTVRVGTADLESGGSTHSVSAVITHELYNTPIRDNDIAVMLLSSAVRLNNRVAVASIPRQGEEVPDNSTVTHVGWGRTNVNINQAASVLQQVTIRTIGFSICYERYSWLSSMTNELYIVTSNMICSGLLDIGGADACQGDSGGPLVYRGIVVGVTSWGFECAEPQFPGVNAKVSAYTNWINRTVTLYNAGPPGSSTSLFLITISVISSLIFVSK